MKPISSWIFKLAFWLLTTLVVLLLIVYPMLSSWLLETGKLLEAELVQPIESAQFWLMGVLASLWVFALGSCFGSFLEVVAERVPRGRSINGSSRCPDCDQKLRFRDNTPIIGWLRCGGKCSNCNSKIPVRYLIVEIVLGAIFLLVAKIQLMGMGSNLPFREISKPNELWLLFLELKNPILDLPIIAFDPKFDLVAITIYHLILTCFLFTFVLIRSENLKIPYRIWICGIIFGILVR